MGGGLYVLPYTGTHNIITITNSVFLHAIQLVLVKLEVDYSLLVHIIQLLLIVCLLTIQ